MNIRAMVHYLGMVLKLEAVFLLLPLGVSLACRELLEARAFTVTAAALLLVGMLTDRWGRESKPVYSREGFLIVAVCWSALSLCGAIPYWLCGVGGFVDCLFESVSGFTTTAASIITDVEALPRSLQLWHSLSLWIGGMGVLVLLLAVVPFVSQGQPYPVLKAESPGPAPGKLVPRLRQSAMILYGIYLGLTGVEIVLLALGGMPLFDSVVTAMSTAGTGGFTVRNASIGGYGSLYTELVILVFMLLCGVNYNLHYFLLARKWAGIRENDEWKAYLWILGVSVLLVAGDLAYVGLEQPMRALRLASFQVVSIGTTTGFTIADASAWPQLSKMILFLLMFVGGCAGSSAGGLKVARIVLLFREAKRTLYRMLHPRSMSIVKLDGKGVDGTVIHGVSNYFILYMLLYFASVLVVSLDNLDFETTLTAAAACINNVGAGLGLVSMPGGYAGFSTASKLALSFNMLLGRLELYPILLLLSRRTWRRV